MAATWLDAPASDDLAVDPEVLVSSLPPGDSLRKYIALHPGANGRHVLVAARDFVAGELVLAEVAVIALPLRSDKDGDDLSSLEAECHRVIFTGPFERVPGAALRVLHQIAPASDVYTVERDKVTRRQVLAAALLRASVRCLCQTDNPYAKPAPQRPVAKDVPSVKSSSAASASTGPVEPVTRISGYDALFVRSSLLRHSCDPTCAFRSSIEASISAPAIQVFALRPIRAGEELTLALVDASLPRDSRERLLCKRYGSSCECRRCARKTCSTQSHSFSVPDMRVDLGGVDDVASDDTIVLRCGVCSTGHLGPAAHQRRGTSEDAPPTSIVVMGCKGCGAFMERAAAAALLSRRNDALAGVSRACGLLQTVKAAPAPAAANVASNGLDAVRLLASAVAELSNVVFDHDAAAFHALHAAASLLYRIEEPPSRPRLAPESQAGRDPDARDLLPPEPLVPAVRSGESQAEALALDLSRRAAAAAELLVAGRVFPPTRLLAVCIDHALLAGGLALPDESSLWWERALPLARTFHGTSAPALVEAIDSFVRKPPRNRGEAALAERLRLHALMIC